MSLHYEKYERLKMLFIVLSVLLVMVAVYATSVLIKNLSEQEKHNIEVWAEATRKLVSADYQSDMDLVLKVINGNNSVPVLLVDEQMNLVSEDYGIRNIDLPEENKADFIKETINDFGKKHAPIVVHIDTNTKYYVYYDESFLIKNLSLVSFILFSGCIVFFIMAFIAFSNTKKAEQNQIWVGLSKETAHQLGTPISSLLAWTEILKTIDIDKQILREMSEDIDRLSLIAERFSKIGSNPTLAPLPLIITLNKAVLYIKNRVSKKVIFETNYHISETEQVMLSAALFEWVIENLCKNAIDAMDGEGRIVIEVNTVDNYYCIDIQDSGKGIPKSKYKTIFTPGYTTKRRGWGLGLSFVKRIVNEYHWGKVFVKHSEMDVGTTFRILLPKKT